MFTRIFATAALMLTVSSAQACESGHWVQQTLADGKIIELEDGTVWKIPDFDAITTMLWLPTDDVLTCDDKLIHVDDGDEVDATRLR